MTHWKTLLIAAPVALGLLAAPAAHAEWRGGGGWGHHEGGWGHRDGGWGRHEGGWGYRGGYEHRSYGVPLAGALLGLGAAAVIGGVIASQQPPVVYAPPPAYYPPPGYYPYPQPYYGAPDYAQ